MAWTYDPSLGSTRDKVRFLIQDTDDQDQLLSDEEIAFALSEKPNIYRAASLLCRAIALNLGRQLTLIDPAMKLDANEQYTHYIELSKQYKAEALASSSGAVFVGGISVSDRDLREIDTDRVLPAFKTSTQRNPGSGLLSDFD